jgi:hypothetical protein
MPALARAADFLCVAGNHHANLFSFEQDWPVLAVPEQQLVA